MYVELVTGLLLFSLATIVSAHLRYEIDESVPRGTIVANIVNDARLRSRYSAADLNVIRFRFLVSSSGAGSSGGVGVGAAVGSSLFEIGPTTGIIRTATAIDRDDEALCRQRQRCELSIDVITQPVQLFQIIKVTVEILDVNDNSPQFRDSEIQLAVIEAAQVGSAYMLPTASDDDGPDNGVQRYELESPPDSADKFALDVGTQLDGSAEVKLRLNDRVDRERQAEYRLRLRAVDGGTPTPRTGTLEVVVVVLDSNDNRPVFNRAQYELTVVENSPVGSVIGRVGAKDADAGPNGLVHYGLAAQTQSLHGHLFGVRNSTGELIVRSTIDRETASLYQLVVIAYDHGPDTLSAETTVAVHVDDLNDNSPTVAIHTLDSASSVSEIPEDSPIGSFVAYMSASDPDAGANGRVDCAVKGGVGDSSSGPFSLVQKYPSEYQIVTATELDRERTPEYSVTVKCWDGGSPVSRITEQSFRLLVGDVNDNVPAFSQQTYRGSIVENNFIGLSVLQVTASDWDEGNNGQVVYSIPSNVGQMFHIDQNGVLTVHSAVDREVYDTFRFPVLAVDGGSPALTGSALVVVSVEDVDDERPHFVQQEFHYEVVENEARAGAQVGFVLARDRDGAPYNGFVYAFHSGDQIAEAAFAVDAGSGAVTLRHPLDRERRAQHRFVVVAYDPESPASSSTATVVVDVADLNDNAPEFVETGYGNNTLLQVSSLTPPGHVIAVLSARDADDGPNAQLMYSLNADDETTSADVKRLFRVDVRRGAVSVGATLPASGLFRMRIVATDRGTPALSASAALTISVNRSLPFNPLAASMSPLGVDGTSLLSSTSAFNLVLLVAVVCGCALVIFVLVVVIALVRHRDQRHHARKYNCRMEALRVITSGGPDPPDVAAGSGPSSTVVVKPASPTTNRLHNGLRTTTFPVHEAPSIKLNHCGGENVERDSVHSVDGDGSITDSGRGPSEEGGDPRASGGGAPRDRYLPPPPPPPRGGAYWAQQQQPLLQPSLRTHPARTQSQPTVRFQGLSTMPEEESEDVSDGARSSKASPVRQQGRRAAAATVCAVGRQGSGRPAHHSARIYQTPGGRPAAGSTSYSLLPPEKSSTASGSLQRPDAQHRRTADDPAPTAADDKHSLLQNGCVRERERIYCDNSVIV